MEKFTLPPVIRYAASFFIIALIFIGVYLAVDVVAPLVMALLMAILLRPISKFLNEKLHLPNIIAVFLVVILAALTLLGMITFLGFQVASFVDDIPKIMDNIQHHIETVQSFIQNQFGINVNDQNKVLEETLSGSQVISLSSLGSITNSFMYIVLIPIFTFLILIYRSLLLNLIIKLVPDHDFEIIQHILDQIKTVVRSYIVGLGMQVLAVSLLTGIGYAIVGVKYYVFLGLMTGLLNLIPYVGIIISCIISCMLTLVTGDDLMPIVWVLVVNMIVQFIDNNILQPKIVGSKVSVNALASMVGVIIGGSLAGIPGMFLAIPVLAILKVIFDNTKGLEPYGYIIGDDIPNTFDWNKVLSLYSKKPLEEKESEDEVDI